MGLRKDSYDWTAARPSSVSMDPATMNACGSNTAQELLHAFETAEQGARWHDLDARGAACLLLGRKSWRPSRSGSSLSHPGSQPTPGRALETHYNR